MNMDELALSVEELDFSLSEKSMDIRGLQNETGHRKSVDSGSKSKEYHLSPLNQTTFESKITSKYSTLPSISPKERPLVDLSLINCDNRQDEACGAIKFAHNRSSLEDLTYDKQQPGPTQGYLGLKSPGKSLLAPLVERKTHLRDNARQRSTTNPELSTSLFKHKNQYEDLQAHQILYAGADGDHETQLRAQFSNESIIKSKEARQIQPNKKLLDVPASTGRRFSAPLSPRFVRRLIRERIYSSSTQRNDDHDPEAGARPRSPERESIFSPPCKEFDGLQVEEKQRDVERKDHSKNQRKNLEEDLRTDSTRFLNEIKVSLPDQSDKHLRQGRVKSTDKRKNSYTLSASGDILPPVKTAMPECQARNRAFSTSGFIPLGRNDVTNKPFDSPMFLDGEAQRLSHLSLSPRLPRKF